MCRTIAAGLHRWGSWPTRVLVCPHCFDPELCARPHIVAQRMCPEAQACRDNPFLLLRAGAGWDFEGSSLCEPQPMELIVPMPIIHFKPVESKKKSSRGVYNCPLYLYPVRTGTRERPSYMGSVDLRAGAADADAWIMRGTALLLSLAN